MFILQLQFPYLISEQRDFLRINLVKFLGKELGCKMHVAPVYDWTLCVQNEIKLRR